VVALAMLATAVGGLARTGPAHVDAQSLDAPGVWEVIGRLPLARNETASATVNGRIYIMGGYGEEPDPSTVVQVYDVASDSWSQAAPAPLALHHSGAAVVDGKIYLVGGFTKPFGERDPVDTLFVYDPATDQWQTRASMLAPSGALAVAVLDGKIFAFGGERKRPAGSNPPYAPVDDAAVYDPQTDRWEALPPLRYRRDHLSASAVNGRVYVMGGRDRPAYDLPFNEVWDPVARTWDLTAPMPTGRSGHTAAVLANHVYTFGGEGNPASPIGIYNQVEVYDPTTDEWAQLDPMPVGRHAVSAVAVGDRIFLPGGSTRQGGAVTDLIDAFIPANQ